MFVFPAPYVVAAASGITVIDSAVDFIPIGASTANITLPTSLENDLLGGAITADADAVSTPSGWNAAFSNSGATNSVNAYVFYKFMGSTPDTTITLDQGGDDIPVAMATFRGVDQSTPIDNTLQSANATTGSPNSPSFTTVTAGAMRIITGHLDDDTIDMTMPSGWAGVSEGSGAPTAGSSSVALGWLLAPSAGALDPDAFGGGGDDNWIATHFALRPA
jgi:hypothetical protein